MKRIFVFLAFAVLGVLASGILLAQVNPLLVGTWKMNAAKSKYSPGPAYRAMNSSINPMAKIL